MFSITVPNEPRALRAAAEFFNTVAGGITVTAMSTPTKGTGDAIALCASIETPAVQPFVPETPVPDAVTVFGTLAPPSVDSEPPVPPAGETAPPPPPTQEPPVPPLEGAGGSGPTLDSRGLPWDARIHASSRSQVADGSWRNRKCPSDQTKEAWDQYIAQVEAELKGVMSVPTPAAAPTPTEAPVPPAAVPISTPLSFADLTAKITSSGIAFDRVTEAVGRVGLPAYPALLNRPDLIPAVHAELFP